MKITSEKSQNNKQIIKSLEVGASNRIGLQATETQDKPVSAKRIFIDSRNWEILKWN